MSEHNEQVMYFKTCGLYAVTDKRYASIFAVPNAFKRTPRQGKWMKDEGLRAGVPDIVVAVPMWEDGECLYPGLFIELKHGRGRLSQSQREWLARLRGFGYAVAVANGCDVALDITRRYFSGEYIQEWKP